MKITFKKKPKLKFVSEGLSSITGKKQGETVIRTTCFIIQKVFPGELEISKPLKPGLQALARVVLLGFKEFAHLCVPLILN